MFKFNIKKVFKNIFIVFLMVVVILLGQVFYQNAKVKDFSGSDLNVLRDMRMYLDEAYILHGSKTLNTEDPKAPYYKNSVELLIEMLNLTLDIEFGNWNLEEELVSYGFDDLDKDLARLEELYYQAYDLYQSEGLEEVTLFHEYQKQTFEDLFTRAHIMREKEGIYTTPYYASALEGLGYGIMKAANPSFILVFFIALLLAIEFSLKDKGIDSVQKDSPNSYLYRIGSFIVLGITVFLVLGISLIGGGLVGGARLGSVQTPILYDPSIYGDMVLINPSLTFVKIFALTLATSLIFYVVYEILRRFFSRMPSLLITILAFLGVNRLSLYIQELSLTADLTYGKTNIPFTMDLQNVIVEGVFPYINLVVLALVLLILYLVNKKRTKLVFTNAYKKTESYKNMGLAKFELSKLRKNNLLNSGLALSLVLALALSYNTGQRKSINTDESRYFDTERDVAQSNYSLNVNESTDLTAQEYYMNEMQARLEEIDKFEEAYLNRHEDPSSYYSLLKDWLSRQMGADIGYDPNLSISNLDRVDYFRENELDPEDGFTLISGSLEPNLMQEGNVFSLYKSKLTNPTEEKGGLGLFISSFETGLPQLGLIVFAIFLASSFAKEKIEGEVNFLLTSPYTRSKLYLSSFLTRLGLISFIICGVGLVFYIYGRFKFGLGQELYPLLSYEPIAADSFKIVYQPIKDALLPMLINSILFSSVVISFAMLTGLFIDKVNGHLIISGIVIIIGVLLAGFGLLGNAAMLNPFAGFDPLLTYKGGINYLNNMDAFTAGFQTIQNIIFTLIFLGIGLWKFKGGSYVKDRKSEQEVR